MLASCLLAIIVFYSQKKSLKSQCTEVAIATIVDVSDIIEYSQSEHQGQVKLMKGWQISYTFIVDEISYSGNYFVPNNLKHLNERSKINSFIQGNELTIRYNPKNPGQNLIQNLD